MSFVSFGPIDAEAQRQLETCQAAEDGALGVLCADHHVGFSCPIGGVVAYRDLISPSAVGWDQGCGNLAVRTNRLVSDVDVTQAMDAIWKTISFGMGRKNAEHVEHPILDEIAECDHPFQKSIAQLAANGLGTCGAGNHYLDLFEATDDGALWVGVHFGSRGFGHKTCGWIMEALGVTDDSPHAPPVVVPVATELGTLFLDGMDRSLRYAWAGREWVVNRVLKILGADATDVVHNYHNAAWRETHGGVDYWVHRKGATPAFPGQRGFVGGTMGDLSVILRGVESPASAAALYSTVHGAGRAMSRTKAAGKFKRYKEWRCGNRPCAHHEAGFPIRAFTRAKDGALPVCPACGGRLRAFVGQTLVTPGLIDWPAVQAEVASKGIVLRGAGADEAPGAYKRIEDVLEYHAGTIEIETFLRPVGVAMAGPDTPDDFRD